ncbi:MAG: hypothetical protein ABGY09_00190 [Euryarchaeota archaeon]
MYAQPYLATLDYRSMGYPLKGVLRFKLEDNRGRRTRELGGIKLPEGYPARPGMTRTLIPRSSPAAVG